MDIHLYFPGNFDKEALDNFRAQGISMDDWDFVLMVKPGNLQYIPDRMVGYGYAPYSEYESVQLISGDIMDIIVAYH